MTLAHGLIAGVTGNGAGRLWAGHWGMVARAYGGCDGDAAKLDHTAYTVT